MTQPRPRVMLYTHGNANIVDGSIVWLTSMAEALTLAGAHVTLLLRANIIDDTMLQDVLANPHITVVEPFGKTAGTTTTVRLLTEHEVVERTEALDDQERFDLVICRAVAPCVELARSGRFTGRLWLYPIDIPMPHRIVSAKLSADLDLLVAEADRVLAQTPQARAFLEYRLPQAIGKTLLVNPMLPDELSPLEKREPRRRLRASYSGKFAPGWRTLEMTQLPTQLAERNVALSITMVGDKIMGDPKDGTWRGRMAEALKDSPGILWAGRVNRKYANALARGADIGLCWRDEALDSTHELSTKLLEYCALGVVPIVNRNAGHEELLGSDYPFFVTDSVGSVLDAIELAAKDTEVFSQAKARALAAVTDYRMSAAAARFTSELERLTEERNIPSPAEVAMVRRPLLPIAAHRIGIDAANFTPMELDSALTAAGKRLREFPDLSISLRLNQYGPIPPGTGNLKAPRAAVAALNSQLRDILQKHMAPQSPLYARVGIEFQDEALPNWVTKQGLILTRSELTADLAAQIGARTVHEPEDLSS